MLIFPYPDCSGDSCTAPWICQNKVKSGFQCVHIFKCPLKGYEARECALERSFCLQCEE